MAKRRTTYGELKDGDRIWVQGYCFVASDVRVTSRKGEKTSVHGEPNTDDVIRFTGHLAAVGPQDIARTGYNHATYGGYAFVPITLEVED